MEVSFTCLASNIEFHVSLQWSFLKMWLKRKISLLSHRLKI